MIGVDGGCSFVWRYVEILFEGDILEDKWICIDGMVEIDMFLNWLYGVIESKIYGNIFWVFLDYGVMCIGYVYSVEIVVKYFDGVI